MKFLRTAYAHDQFCTFRFTTLNNFKTQVVETFEHLFQRLGGVFQKDDCWIFPKYISSQTIEEVISNTCLECGGLMKESTAIMQDDVLHKGFGNTEKYPEAGDTVFPQQGNVRHVKVRKCTECGHSHT